jgi:hypothetical protein
MRFCHAMLDMAILKLGRSINCNAQASRKRDQRKSTWQAIERKRRQNEQPKRAPFREKERVKKDCDPNPANPNRKGEKALFQLLAHSGHSNRAPQCPLSGEDRTSAKTCHTCAAGEPQRKATVSVRGI